jgi:hypothetical protein
MNDSSARAANTTADTVQRFAALFHTGAPDFYWADIAKAIPNEKGKLVVNYWNCPRALTPDDYAAHLDGTRGLVIAPVDAEGFAEFGAIDVDLYDLDAPGVVVKIAQLKIPLLVCLSKSGGLHLYYFGARIAARELRRLLQEWSECLGFAGSEIFPKQDKLDPNAKGSAINLPYFGGAANKLIDKRGDRIELEDFLTLAETFKTHNTGDVRVDVRVEAAAQLLAPHWEDGKRRHDLALEVSGTLLRTDEWEQDRVLALINRVIELTGDDEPTERRKCVREAARSIDSGKNMWGAPTLTKRLGAATVKEFLAACGIKQQPPPAFPTALVLPVSTFNKLELPQREEMIEGLLLTQTLILLYAQRGLGKTMVALQMAVSLAQGKPFLVWAVPRARRVLFVDGEMAGSELQERLVKFCGDNVPDCLDIIASEVFFGTEGGVMNLADPVQQEKFLGLLDALEAQGRTPEVIFLDNKSALTSGTDENSNSEQDALLAFLIGLRHRHITVVLVHHAGKGGDQRGASRNEDFIDLVIKLVVPEDEQDPDSDEPPPQSSGGAAFRVSFTKHRSRKRPDPPFLDVELMEDMDGVFTWSMDKPRRTQNWLRVAEYIRDHAPDSQAQCWRALDINKANMTRYIKKLRARNMLEDGDLLRLSKSGLAYMNKARPKADK